VKASAVSRSGTDHDVARDPVEYVRARHEEEQRDETEEKSEEETARITHENLGRREVVPQKREDRAAYDERDRDDERLREEIPRDGERGRGDEREPGGEPVETIDQIERGRYNEHPERNREKERRQEIHGDARRAKVHEESEPHRGDEDRDRDLENELVDVMEAPEIVDDPEEKDEKAARDEDGRERLLDRAAGEIEEKERDECEQDRADDSDTADMGDIPARAPVRLLADLETHRDPPHERRKEGTERKR